MDSEDARKQSGVLDAALASNYHDYRALCLSYL